MIKTGLVSITFRRFSPQEVVDLVTNAGIDSIEWGGDVHAPHGDAAVCREVGTMTRDAGVAVSAYGSYYRLGVSEQDDLRFEQVLESAAALKAPTIRVWAGKIPSRRAEAADYERLAEESCRIADIAQNEGISVSFEYHKGTLTDTNESAQKLLATADHPNLKTFWQPPNNQTTDYCLEGLKAVLPRLTNLHVFHWEFPEGQKTIKLLEEGADRWRSFFSLARRAEGDRYASLEFVADDSTESFAADAAVLKKLVAEANGQ